MLDSIEGYLDNIGSAATQPVENGGPLAEFSARLAFFIDTVAVQAKEIKILYQHINAIKKKGTSSETNAGGVMTGNVCPHCSVVRRSGPHKKGSCNFDKKKTTEMR